MRGVISDLSVEMRHLDELVAEMKSIGGGDTPILRRSRASILHDFYNGCERMFRRIAADPNGGIDESEARH
jgi:hypothetical protein